MPGGGGPADDPAGKRGEHIDGGLVRDHGVQCEKIPVHQDGRQVVERVLVQVVAEHVETKTRMLRGEAMEDLAEREATVSAHGHRTLPNPVPKGIREPERCFRHGHSGSVPTWTRSWTTDDSPRTPERAGLARCQKSGLG